MPLKSKNMIDENDVRVARFGHPAPPWMVNYADLMTEMVCFFLILYSMTAALSKPMQAASKEENWSPTPEIQIDPISSAS